MKLVEIREITREEYDKLKDYYSDRDTELCDYHEKLSGYRPIAGSFYALSQAPCRYNDSFFDLKGDKHKGYRLPKSFKLKEKVGYTTMHFSPAGCCNLEYGKSIVECITQELADVKVKRYHCRHVVGQCPFKEADL